MADLNVPITLPQVTVEDRIAAIPINDIIDYLIARKNFFPRDIKIKLASGLAGITLREPAETSVDGNENIDMYQEVADQLRAVKGLRSRVINEDGTVPEGVPVREAKDALASLTTLLSLLVRMQSDVMDMKRVQTIQSVTIEVMKEVDVETFNKFIKRMKEKLGVNLE